MSDTWWVGPEQLNNEQKAVIDLPLDGSYLVKGPPGSGKTNLLLLRANYMYLAGKANIQVVVFTRTLQEFIASGSEQYNFPGSKVTTCRKWQQNLLSEYDCVAKPTSEDFKAQRAFYAEQVERLVDREGLEGIFDAILLDEAQDYLPSEIRTFRKLSSSFFAVADSRQKIYDGEDCFDLLTSCVDGVRELKYHYRSGSSICKIADALAKGSTNFRPLVPTSNYNEKARPASVQWYRCADRAEEASKIIQRLRTQLKAYPGELLGVVCPKSDDALFIWERIQNSSLADSAVLQVGTKHSPFSPEKQICVASLHAAKGLEMRALHIAALDQIKNFKSKQRNLIFTGVTRAKTSLSFYYSADLPGYIDGAINSLKPLPDLPSVKDAFGGRR